MLHALEIENFHSVFDHQLVDLSIADNAPERPFRFAPLWKGSTERGPKVLAIFGPNASGKTTVLRAISFLAWFIRDSFALLPDRALPYERFNSQLGHELPTRLAVSFGGLADPVDGEDGDPECRYRYELELSGTGVATVTAETLYYWPPPHRRRVRLFRRDRAGKVVGAPAFGLGGFTPALEKILRPNASVIATLAQLKHPFATAIWEAVAYVYSNAPHDLGETAEARMVRLYASDAKLLASLNREIDRIDLGIKSVRIEQGPSGPVALFTHEGHDGPMPLALESHGTRAFLQLYPYLLGALQIGGIAVLDELDTAIHPLILPEILRWFHDPMHNPHNAQLWMTCHNASLLDDLEKEEVLFTEKDRTGRTEIFALSDIQAVRREDNFYRKYLGGTYGAVPNIG